MLALDAETTAQARAMAGEKAVALTSDRENILIACAAEVEEYIGKMYYRGLAGAARAATSVVEIDAPGDVPAIPQLPLTYPLNVTSVARWNTATEAFQAESYAVRPLGAIGLSVCRHV